MPDRRNDAQLSALWAEKAETYHARKKALEAADTGQGPGQTAGTGDQKLVGELTEALSRVLCPPHPQGHQLVPWGGPEPNHRSSENTYCFYNFLLEMKLLVTERFQWDLLLIFHLPS